MKKIENLYNLKIITSGDRLEIYKMNNYLARTDFEREIEKAQDTKDDKKGIQSLKDRKATLNKARNNIMRLIKSNPDMTTFITLTFSNVQDYKKSKQLLNIFFTKLRRDYTDLKYIWVLELGDKNKRLHYHLLTNVLVPLNLSGNNEIKSYEHKIYEEQFRKAYWPHGFVDIRDLDQEDNTNIALYVSAYIVKSLLDINIDGRVYGYSHKTIDRPVETKLYSNCSIEELLNHFKEYKIGYTNSYKIGFTDWQGERKGTVTYFDMSKK